MSLFWIIVCIIAVVIGCYIGHTIGESINCVMRSPAIPPTPTKELTAKDFARAMASCEGIVVAFTDGKFAIRKQGRNSKFVFLDNAAGSGHWWQSDESVNYKYYIFDTRLEADNALKDYLIRLGIDPEDA